METLWSKGESSIREIQELFLKRADGLYDCPDHVYGWRGRRLSIGSEDR